jgi:type I restriction enzyme M protein
VGGFRTVFNGWVTTIETGLDDKTSKGNPLDHRLVRVLLPEYLDDIEMAENLILELDAMIKGALSSSDDDVEDISGEEDVLSPAELAALKKALTVAKKRARALEQEFVTKLEVARSHLSPDDVQQLVLRIMQSDLTDHLYLYVSKQRRVVISALCKWWDKYGETLRAVECDQRSASTKLASFLLELGYD